MPSSSPVPAARFACRARSPRGRRSTGAYRFTVHKTSQSGASNVRQSGEFSAGAGEAVSVGMFGTNDQPDSSYALALVVTVDGQEKCRVTYDGPVSAGRED